jgi:hypothetical protein
MHYYTIVDGWPPRRSATAYGEREWFAAMKAALRVDELIARHSAIMDRYDPEKRVALLVGEWGMWHAVEPGTNPGFLYQQNTIRDALVAAASLDIFNSHADRVRGANIAQMVNVLQAMILTRGSQMLLTPHVPRLRLLHGAPRRRAAADPRGVGGALRLRRRLGAGAQRVGLARPQGVVHVTMSNLDPNQARTVETSCAGDGARRHGAHPHGAVDHQPQHLRAAPTPCARRRSTGARRGRAADGHTAAALGRRPRAAVSAMRRVTSQATPPTAAMTTLRRALPHALLAAALAACGGGGGGSGSTGPTPTPPTPTPTPTPPVSAVRGVHDPVVAKDNGVYWLYATGDGIPIRRSTDLITWDTAGRVFPGRTPAWAPTAVPGVEFPWAPDISYFNGRWHLYYSLSTFGSQRSVIGVATNATLDPRDARYRWDDQGAVVESRPGVSTFNAIDPNVALDAEGAPWLTWGSFWGGIMLRRLDAATGKLATTGTRRPTRSPRARGARSSRSRRRRSYARGAGTTCSPPTTSAAAARRARTTCASAGRARSPAPTSTATASRSARGAARWCSPGAGACAAPDTRPCSSTAPTASCSTTSTTTWRTASRRCRCVR